jgi:hypothetical protein
MRKQGQGTLDRQKGTTRWTIQYVDANGRRHKESTGTADRSEAL